MFKSFSKFTMSSAGTAPSMRRSVSDVMSTFHRTLDELKRVEEDHAAESVRHAEIAANAAKRQKECDDEVAYAQAVHAKLSDLVSTPVGVPV